MKKQTKRILLKLSGEALLGDKPYGIDYKILDYIVDEIIPIHEDGIEIAIVIGAGNIWRGAKMKESGIDRVPSDYMGMLGTVMNSLALQAAFEKKYISTRVLSSLSIPEACELFNKRRAIHHLEKNRIVICAGGTGNPFFTTDSAAALRALELQCDMVLKATNVDGVYTDDPRTNPDAQKIEIATFDEVLEQNLHVMDGAAIALCRDNDMPIKVFKLIEKGNIQKAVQPNGYIGTLITHKE